MLALAWQPGTRAAASAAPSFYAEQKAGALKARGNLSSSEHAAILHDVAASLYGDNVQLELELSSPTPPGWALVTEQVIRALASADDARAEVSPGGVTMSGSSSDADRWRRAAAAVRQSLVPGMRFTDNVIFQASDESFAALCRRQFDGALARRTVRFPLSGSELGPGAEPLLDALVEIAADCPAARIFVSGHTDGTGEEAGDVALSLARANAVAVYLSGHGVDAGRITTAGLGSSRPLSDGTGPRARAANRRIEFRIEIAE